MKKKVLSVLLIGILQMSMIACGKESTTKELPVASEAETILETQQENTVVYEDNFSVDICRLFVWRCVGDVKRRIGGTWRRESFYS